MYKFEASLFINRPPRQLRGSRVDAFWIGFGATRNAFCALYRHNGRFAVTIVQRYQRN